MVLTGGIPKTLASDDVLDLKGVPMNWKSSDGNSTWFGIDSSGNASLLGDLTVNTDKFVVTASSGNTTVAGTLGVTGAATFSGSRAVLCL